jgi:hypothetical protein
MVTMVSRIDILVESGFEPTDLYYQSPSSS